MKHEKYDSIILNDDDSVVCYVSDMETYELLHVTKAGLRLYGMKSDRDYEGKPCYEVLQGLDKPCPFCTNSMLKYGEHYKWEHFNDKLKRWMGIEDAMILLDGRKCRLERAKDITEEKNQLRRLHDQLSLEEILLECLRVLSKEQDCEVAFQEFLGRLGRYYRAERAYIFEFDLDKQLIYNTYEWCAANVTSEKANLQAIPIEYLDRWLVLFQQEGEFCISYLDKDVDRDSIEYKILKAQGIKSLMAAPIYQNNNIIGFLGVDDPSEGVNDLTLLRASVDFIGEELKKRSIMEQLRFDSYVDLLTGLNNRNKYTKVIKKYEENSPKSLGIVFADVNGIKNINDTYGHEYGDKLLITVAGIMKEIAKEDAYRIGGDEFIILLEGISEEDFQSKIKALKQRIEEEGTCDVSVGSVWKAGNCDVKQMLKQADEQMYAEKQKYYQNALSGEKSIRIGIASAVEKEILENRFAVFYQPQVDITSGQLVGAEALVRKIAMDGKIIAPDRFIPYYEIEGVIRHVDLFVLESVCRVISQWAKEMKVPKVAVNFSRVTLMEEHIVDTIRDICNKYHVPPEVIAVEVTESVNKLEPQKLNQLIRELRECRFSIVLDDFGSKYSNIAMLSEISFDVVKIDKSLVDKIESNEKSRIITWSIIQMCHKLKRTRVLAEGIETEEQKEILKKWGCEYGQGFLYSRPVPLEEFQQLLKVKQS